MQNVSEDNKEIHLKHRRATPFDRYQKMRSQVEHRRGRVLDIGTCDFAVLDLFQSFNRFAIDIIRHKAPLSVHFTVADCSNGLPFLDNQFEVVIAGEVIEHLFDTEEFVTELYRVLKVGGELVLSTPNMAYWRNYIQVLKSENPFWVDWKKGQNGHVRYFSPRTMREILDSAGFKDVVVTTAQDVTQGTNFALRMLGEIFQRLSPLHNMLLIAKARKEK